MLTDEDLTTGLGAAFRGTTEHLTYQGRTRPRRTASVALPLVAASVTAGAIVLAAHPWTEPPGPVTARPAIGHRTSPSPSVQTSTGGRVVEQRISLAGFTLTYVHRVGDPDPLHAELRPAGLPSGLRAVPLSGTEAKAWVGKDPATGENALYVKAPTRNHNRLFVLLSSRWSQQQLVQLIRTGEPRTVPLTTG